MLALEDSAMDVDQVENLIKFCPTKEEMELLKVENALTHSSLASDRILDDTVLYFSCFT